MNLIERQLAEITDEFAEIETGLDRYEYLTELANNLSPYPQVLRTQDRLVPDCSAPVWLNVYGYQGRFYFQGDSDASFDRGILLLLQDLLDGAELQDAAETSINLMSNLQLSSGPWAQYQRDVEHITQTLRQAARKIWHKATQNSDLYQVAV